MGMDQFWITLLSIATGAGGYLITTFWMRSIFLYRNIKYKVASDLVFFANTLDLKKLDGSYSDKTPARNEVYRRYASDIAALYNNKLPFWYKLWLKLRKADPKLASSELIGLSNESNGEEAKLRIKNIKEYLKIPLDRP